MHNLNNVSFTNEIKSHWEEIMFHVSVNSINSMRLGKECVSLIVWTMSTFVALVLSCSALMSDPYEFSYGVCYFWECLIGPTHLLTIGYLSMHVSSLCILILFALVKLIWNYLHIVFHCEAHCILWVLKYFIGITPWISWPPFLMLYIVFSLLYECR